MVLKRQNVYAFDENERRIYDENEVNKIYGYFKKLENSYNREVQKKVLAQLDIIDAATEKYHQENINTVQSS